MKAPADFPLAERMQWAAISAIVGVLHDGPEIACTRRLFQRLEAACRSFGVPQSSFDECAKLLDFHYVRNGDYYASKKELDASRATMH